MGKISSAKIVFFLCLGTSIALTVAGFIVPPTGIIDGSVLTVVGELLGFATIGMLPTIIDKHNVKIQHGNTTINVSDDKTDEEDEG